MPSFKILSKILTAAFSICFILTGCQYALKRGIYKDAYISTARPAIMLHAKNMPFMLGGRGTCNLVWSDMAGGLPVSVWLSIYGAGGLSPMAIMAQAQCPSGWCWDSDMRWPFSVDAALEEFNGTTYQACTYIVNPQNDPFGNMITSVQTDGTPQLWLVRAYAARFNFNHDKIIMEYREPLPQGITTLAALPQGSSDLLFEFANRARNALAVGNPPENMQNIQTGYANAVRWQDMGNMFLGTASKDAPLFMR